jgi:hypothetical protein
MAARSSKPHGREQVHNVTVASARASWPSTIFSQGRKRGGEDGRQLETRILTQLSRMTACSPVFAPFIERGSGAKWADAGKSWRLKL